jgi:hypothetical protein
MYRDDWSENQISAETLLNVFSLKDNKPDIESSVFYSEKLLIGSMQIDIKSFAAKLAKSDYINLKWLGRIGDEIYSD